MHYPGDYHTQEKIITILKVPGGLFQSQELEYFIP